MTMFEGAQNVDASQSKFIDITVNIQVSSNLSGSLNSSNSPAWELLKKRNIEDALHNSGERDPSHYCLPNTRNDVFRAIGDILENPNACICWLSGRGGTGKSTIAYTLADKLEKQEKLLASFFFSNKRIERSRTKNFFCTIAYQLAVKFPHTAKSNVLTTLENDPSVLDKILRHQCEKLFTEPLLSLPEEQLWSSPKVIVIDALDECKSEAEQLVRLLVDALQNAQLPPLRIFLTSRPEVKPTTFPDIDSFVRHISLDHFQADGDIRRYLVSRFEIIDRRLGLQLALSNSQTSSLHHINALVEKSCGLFIYASTVMNFIGSDSGNPCDKLRALLEEQSSAVVYDDLDRLFRRVMSSPKSKNYFAFAGIIVHLAAPLSAQELRLILPYQLGDVEAALDAFSSVFSIPTKSDEQVQICHDSFRDFLTNPERSRDYFCDTSSCYRDIAIYCLKFLNKTLRRNICNIGDSLTRNDAVEDLDSRCRENIHPALQYCCRYWATHISMARMNPELKVSLTAFLEKSLLYWLETLSLMRELGAAISILQETSAWYKTILGTSEDDVLMTLLCDAKRFTLQFFDVINDYALQVYDSALLFTPKKTLLRKKYPPKPDGDSVTIVRGLEDQWDSCIRAIKLKSIVESIAFSPDGLHCASASKIDGVKLWNTITGLNTASFVGNGHHPRLVTFTPDGAHIAAGYEDGTIGIWGAADGRTMVNTKRHHRRVTSLAFSFDNAWLASASEDKAVLLWNVGDGGAPREFSGHEKAVNCVAFSPDNIHVISASEDGAIFLWDIDAGSWKYHKNGDGERITSVAFSPRGLRIGIGSVDGTVRILDASTGDTKCLMSEKGQLAVTSIIFASEHEIVSSFNDGTVRCWNADIQHTTYIWDIVTSLVRPIFIDAVDVDWNVKWMTRLGITGILWSCYLYIQPVEHKTTTAFSPGVVPFAFECYNLIFTRPNLSRHDGPMAFISPGDVTALAISSDGNHVASCVRNTIHLWDTSLQCKTWKEFHTAFTGHVMGMLASSFDGKYFAILSLLGYSLVDSYGKVLCILDGMITIWRRPYQGEHNARALFSPDSSTLAYWHISNHEVKLFSTKLGRHTRTLRFFTWRNPVASVVFSHMSLYIACGYEDGSIRLWAAKTGHMRTVLKMRHRRRVTSIAFSEDDEQIVSASGDLSIYAVPSGELVSTLPRVAMNAAAFLPHDINTICASDSRTIWLWKTSSSPCRFASVPHDILSLGFSGDGNWLFCTTSEKITYVWTSPFVDAAQPDGQEGGVEAPQEFSSKLGEFCDFNKVTRYVLKDGRIFDGDKPVCCVPVGYRASFQDDFRGIRDGLIMRVASTNKLVILRFPSVL